MNERDPTMDEILASIRRIITEEEQGGAASAPTRSRRASPRPEPLTAPEPEPETAQSAEADEELSFEDTLARVAASMKPTPDPGALTEPAPPAVEDDSVLELTRPLADGGPQSPVVADSGPSIESLARSMLEPMLRDWIDTHLSGIVEVQVARELKRITGRA